ncbi:azurin [Candidimonas sp. SYP-B2681]|uniref:azurin n=1 Tax=Candidimonas sp. SYP-B2681 TaxID=2497686 RepID=UPI000F88C4CC|nr:azurin [Candidimonas sp. SYP-B2681]RTZ45455.1 azurin [Candidimonas sp. SYP-B2681]
MKRQLLAVAILSTISLPALAAECEATIEANDAMQFDVKTMEVPQSCEQFTVTLKHVGKLPSAAMGHNFVLGLTKDQTAINADGMKAGAAANYVQPDDARVIAATKIIGGGESTSVSFPVSKLQAGESYTYFCSFPGHASIMKGELKLGA